MKIAGCWRATHRIAAKKKVGVAVLTFPLVVAGGLLALADRFNRFVPRLQVFLDPDGAFATVNNGGPTDTSRNPFFLDMGSNGRRCVTCHEPSDAWTVTPTHIQARFNATLGTDPIFRPVDGANCPTADVSSVDARRKA